MKRLAATTALALSLAALPSAGQAQVPAPTPARPPKITYIQGVTGNPFYMSVTCGGAEAARRLGVTFDAQGPAQYTPALQLRVLNAVIAAQPDGILITPDDPVALTPTLLEAKERGIKIITIDSDTSDKSVALTNIQSNNYDGGKQAAQIMVKLLDGKGEVMAMMNSPAANVAQQRLFGFQDEIAKHPGITYLGVQYSNNQTAKAASIITSTVAAHPNLAGVFTITTNNTEGAATGVREAQREGKIRIVGFDTSDPIVEAIRKGVVSADVVQYPYRVGQMGVELMVDALAGKPMERQQTTPFIIATPENIDTPEVQKYIYRTNCQ